VRAAEGKACVSVYMEAASSCDLRCWQWVERALFTRGWCWRTKPHRVNTARVCSQSQIQIGNYLVFFSKVTR